MWIYFQLTSRSQTYNQTFYKWELLVMWTSPLTIWSYDSDSKADHIFVYFGDSEGFQKSRTLQLSLLNIVISENSETYNHTLIWIPLFGMVYIKSKWYSFHFKQKEQNAWNVDGGNWVGNLEHTETQKL